MHLKQKTNKTNLGFISLLIAILVLFAKASPSLAATNDRIHTTKDKCFENRALDAFALGEQISYGDNISRKYEPLLYGSDLNPNEEVIEPLQVAYGFYVIAERIGDARARSKQDWVIPYISLKMRDKVASAIYKKYSADYLKKCFVTTLVKKKIEKNPTKDPNYFLYMYND